MDIYYEVLRDYRKIDKHDDQYDFGTVVIDKLTLNAATFPALPYPITGAGSLTVTNEKYNDLINAANGGDHDAIVARDTYRDKTWIPIFDETADYIEDVADGDQNIILMSGYTPTKSVREPAVRPKQMHVEAKSFNVGELTYKSDKIGRAHV